MTKRHFIALADAIRDFNSRADVSAFDAELTEPQVNMLADFCQAQNTRFNRSRWLAYVAGECGPNGGQVK